VDKKLAQLTERLQAAFGDRLVSAVLYGSAATGDWHEHASDLNVLCVLTHVTPLELGESEPIFRWWRELGNPPPLLMSAEEVRGSADCFPMEFHDMKAHRRVLTGVDVIDDLEIDKGYYRAQVEHELRAKLLRLRQKAAGVLSKPEQLLKLLVDSVSTFCVLARHALILGGREPKWRKHEVVSELALALGKPLTGFTAVLDVRHNGKLPEGMTAALLFERYLSEVDSLVEYVDHFEK
jgi:predicted nucleotidyltransferase